MLPGCAERRDGKRAVAGKRICEVNAIGPMLFGPLIDNLSPLILSDSPSFFYKLNEASGTTMIDSGSGANNGTYFSNATLNYPGFTSPSCISVGSSTVNHTALAISTTANLVGSSPFSLVCAFKVATGSTDRALITKNVPGSTYADYFLRINAAGTMHFDTSNTSGGSGLTVITSVARFDDGVPHLCVVERDFSASTITMYIDNVSVTSATFSGSIGGSTAQVGIGCSYSPSLGTYSTQPLSGILSHCALIKSVLGPTRRAAYQAVFLT